MFFLWEMLFSSQNDQVMSDMTSWPRWAMEHVQNKMGYSSRNWTLEIIDTPIHYKTEMSRATIKE